MPVVARGCPLSTQRPHRHIASDDELLVAIAVDESEKSVRGHDVASLAEMLSTRRGDVPQLRNWSSGRGPAGAASR